MRRRQKYIYIVLAAMLIIGGGAIVPTVLLAALLVYGLAPIPALLAPAHQFPLGTVLHPERRAAAVAWARATGGLLIEDDYDAELRYDSRQVAALKAMDRQGRVIFVGSFSPFTSSYDPNVVIMVTSPRLG